MHCAENRPRCKLHEQRGPLAVEFFNTLITRMLQKEDFVAWKPLWFALNRNAIHATAKERK